MDTLPWMIGQKGATALFDLVAPLVPANTWFDVADAIDGRLATLPDATPRQIRVLTWFVELIMSYVESADAE